MMSTVPLISLLVFVLQADCAKILAVFHVASVSHQVVFQPIWKELSFRGHEVTVLTPNPLNDPSLTNLTEIDLSSFYDRPKEADQRIAAGMDHWRWIRHIDSSAKPSAEALFSHHGFQELIRDKSKQFDIVLVEAQIPAAVVLSFVYNCPLVGISSLSISDPFHEMVGTPTHPILYPDYASSFGEELTFYERVDAVMFYWFYRYKYFYETLPAMDTVVKKHFGANVPDIREIISTNMSMVFLNTHPLLHRPRPYGPNVIEMGGRLHLKPSKPLPQELQEYLDNSTNGAIYFSLGSNVKSAALKPERVKIIIQALSELPYNILWKYETENLEDQPKNVKISKWLPQQDILRHKNIKFFIMQGGLQSLEEAILNTVPVLAIPFFSDQVNNAERIEALGIGRKFEIGTLTKESFKAAILEVINNKRYKERMAEVGRLLNDESTSGLEKTIWWIEYVTRNKGAAHFRNRVIDMSWYEYLMLDVYGFLAITGFLICFVIYKVLTAALQKAAPLFQSNKIKAS